MAIPIELSSIYATGWKVPIADPTGWENVVPPAALHARIWEQLTAWTRDSVRIATAPTTTTSPDVRQHVVELLRWTGWSNRELAQSLDTTHPTIGGIASGRSVDLTRRPELRKTIDDLYTLCRRLIPVVGQAPGDLSRLLKLSVGDETVVDIALRGDLPQAYLAALRALTPDHEAHGMPVSIYAKVPGTATAALHD